MKFHAKHEILLKEPDTHTHTRLTALFPGLPGWAGTRKVKPIWILLKQETVSGSGISWAICKSASLSRQIIMPVPRHSVFYRPDALLAAQPTASKHWRTWQCTLLYSTCVTELAVTCCAPHFMLTTPLLCPLIPSCCFIVQGCRNIMDRQALSLPSVREVGPTIRFALPLLCCGTVIKIYKQHCCTVVPSIHPAASVVPSIAVIGNFWSIYSLGHLQLGASVCFQYVC